MKNFKIGQKVFQLQKDYVWKIEIVEIIKVYPNTNRWRVKYKDDFFKEKDVIIERIRDDNELFLTFDEAFKEAMHFFDFRIKGIEESRTKFIERNKEEK